MIKLFIDHSIRDTIKYLYIYCRGSYWRIDENIYTLHRGAIERSETEVCL